MSSVDAPGRSVVWRGELEYRGDRGLRGVEHWSVTVEEDGSRTLSARCRMFDSQLERWVVHSVDHDFQPLRSFVTHRKQGEFLGEGWFRFTPGLLMGDSHLAGEGDLHQEIRIDGDLDYFVPHSVAADAWITPCYDLARGGWQEIRNGYASSLRADGATGPLIEHHRGLRITLVGEESVTVPAGNFDTRHFVVSARQGVEEHLWVTRDAAATLVRLRSDRLATSYVLTDVAEEPLWPPLEPVHPEVTTAGSTLSIA